MSDGIPRTLVLLRHAKSDWGDEDLPDHERPLADRGRRDAPAVGRRLLEQRVRPDLVLCSTALRTRQTWALVAEAAAYEAPVRLVAEIYQAWSDTLADLLRSVPDEVRTVVLVGHAPGLPDLAEQLNRLSGDGPLPDYPTSGLARFSVSGAWADLGPGSAELLDFSAPRG